MLLYYIAGGFLFGAIIASYKLWKNSVPHTLDHLDAKFTGQNSDPCLFRITKGTVSALLVGCVHILPIKFLHPKIMEELEECDTIAFELSDEAGGLFPVENEFDPRVGELYKKAPEHIKVIIDGVLEWLTDRSFFNFTLYNTPMWLVDYLVVHLTSHQMVTDSLEMTLVDQKTLQHLSLDTEEIRQECRIHLLNEHKKNFLFTTHKDLIHKYEGICLKYISSGVLAIAQKYLENPMECFTPQPEDQLLINKRNGIWMEKIKQWTQDYSNSIAFVVGVAHLVGEEGLLSKLDKQGYSIEKMDKHGKWLLIDI